MVVGQAAAPDRDERLPVHVDDADLRDAGLDRRRRDAVPGENQIVLVDDDRPGGADRAQGVHGHGEIAGGMGPAIRRVGVQVGEAGRRGRAGFRHGFSPGQERQILGESSIF